MSKVKVHFYEAEIFAMKVSTWGDEDFYIYYDKKEFDKDENNYLIEIDSKLYNKYKAVKAEFDEMQQQLRKIYNERYK